MARVDGHSMLPPGYIQTAVETLSETGAVNVGGIMAAEGVTPFQQAVAWAMTSPFGVGAARNSTPAARPGPAETGLPGRLPARGDRAGRRLQRGLTSVAEDWELNHRIRQAGGLIWFQPAMRVTYRPRATVARARRASTSATARWRRVVARQHPGTINLRYLAPPIAVLAMAAGALAGWRPGRAARRRGRSLARRC